MEQSEADCQPGCCGGLPGTETTSMGVIRMRLLVKDVMEHYSGYFCERIFFWQGDEINIELYGL